MLQYNATVSGPSPIKGFEREIFIGELLSNMLPPHYRIGTGVVVDSYDNTSSQTDIIIEYPYGIRFPIGTGATSMYLAESVAATIEVKSNFTKQWKQIHEKIYNNRSILRRQYKLGSLIKDEDRIQSGHNVFLPIFIVAYKGPKKLDTIRQYIGKLKRNFPTGILIIESGIYVGFSPRNRWREAVGKAESIFAFMSDVNDCMKHDVSYTWDLDHYLKTD